jgi:hypothetical protein
MVITRRVWMAGAGDREVQRGQSGAPVLSQDTEAVLGIVEGQWLRGLSVQNPSSTGKPASNMGAAIPITYALPLLDARHIPWHAAASSAKSWAPPVSGEPVVPNP